MSTEINQRLTERAERGEWRGAAAMMSTAQAELDPTRSTLSRDRRGRSAWVFALGSAVAVFALIGGVALLFRAGSGSVGSGPETTVPAVVSSSVASSTVVPTTEAPVVATTEVPAATTTTAAMPAVPVLPAGLDMTWVQAPTQAVFGVSDGVWTVIEGGPGLIAVGVVEDSMGWTDGAVWVSTDGLSWERVGDSEVFGGVLFRGGTTDLNQVILDVAAGPGGYVAVGWVDRDTGDVDPPIWFSPDGSEWERITGYGETLQDTDFASVVVDAAGFVAIGNEVWRSPDGQAWTRVDEQGLEDLDGCWVGCGHIESAMTSESGLAFVANENVEGTGRALGDPFVSTSPDGAIWTQNSLTSDRGWGGDIGLIDGRIVVSGFDASGVALWASGDGTTWERLGNITGLDRVHFPTAPLAEGDRWVLGSMEFTGGSPLGAALVFVSDDGGMTWHEVATMARSPEGPFDGTVDQRAPGIRDLIRFGDVFVAVGGTGNGSAPVWIGSWSN